jgi:acyl-CoA thioester hydrolase
MGVVYYANYLVWFEVARTDLLRNQGWSYRAMEASGVVLPVIEAQCHYRRPARYDEEMEIRTEARILSPVRMEFRYEVTAKGQTGVLASGRTVHAAVGRDGRPCRLPAQVAKALA